MARQTTIRQRKAPLRSSKAPRAKRSARPSSQMRSTRSHRVPRKQQRKARAVPGRAIPRSASSAKDRGIQRFLDRFTQALTAGEGQAAAACFEYPSLMVMSAVGEYGGAQAIDDERSAAGFFEQAPQQYHAKGIEETFPEVEWVEWISHDLALAQVHFPYIDADGNDLGDGETSVYVLRKAGAGYAICAAITLGTDSERPRVKGIRWRRGQ